MKYKVEAPLGYKISGDSYSENGLKELFKSLAHWPSKILKEIDTISIKELIAEFKDNGFSIKKTK